MTMVKKVEIVAVASQLSVLAALVPLAVLYQRISHAVSPDPAVRGLVAAAAVLTGIALCVGLVVLLPMVRGQAGELHRLRALTVRLTDRSSEMERAALTDALTGLSNRRFFDESLSEFVAEFARVRRPLGLILIDLDRFKSVNDTHGHDAGDRVLQAVAACLLDVTRFHDVVARLGGEEFAVIAANLDVEALPAFAERLRGAIERLVVPVGNVRLRVTASFGLAVAEAGEEAAALYKRADLQLYGAKQGGRNRICA